MYEFDKHIQYAFTQVVVSSGHSFLLTSETLLGCGCFDIYISMYLYYQPASVSPPCPQECLEASLENKEKY